MGRAPGAPEPVARDSRADEDLVRRFLADVRAGSRMDLAGRYLAPRVLAHQGLPGAVSSVVVRTPGEYVDHVLQMLDASGPWTFDVLTVRRTGELVDVTWRQTGTVNAEGPSRGRPLVEHGHAAYLVAGGRITRYWIKSTHEVLRHPTDPVEGIRPSGGHRCDRGSSVGSAYSGGQPCSIASGRSS